MKKDKETNFLYYRNKAWLPCKLASGALYLITLANVTKFLGKLYYCNKPHYSLMIEKSYIYYVEGLQ